MTTVRWTPGPDPVSIRGDGLLLREWTEADLARLPDLFDEPEIARWTPLESPFDLAAARRYLTRALDRRQQGNALQFAITTDGVLPLGEVLLFDQGGRIAELGYSVGAAHRGRRLASRAVRLLVQRAGHDWGMRRFRLQIEPENAASNRVAMDAGFTRTGDLPLPIESKGRTIRLAVWEHRPRAEQHPEPDTVSPDPSRGVTPLNSPRAGRQQG